SERPNLAAGKTVKFAPTPNYRLTRANDTDTTDLTDGRLSTHKRSQMWFEDKCVGWQKAGLCGFAIDLGQVEPIDEVVWRVQGGEKMPVWVEVLVSDDGRHYYRVAQYSTFRDSDHNRYGLPRDYEGSFIFPLQFTDLKTRGRYLGIRFYCSGLVVSDEVFVRPGDHAPEGVTFSGDSLTNFTVDGLALYFQKPTVKISTNIFTPIPLGIMRAPELEEGKSATCTMDIPRGISFKAGSLLGIDVAELEPVDRDEEYAYYEIPVEIPAASTNNKRVGRVYFDCDWPEGKRGVIRHQMKWEGGSSVSVGQPVEAMVIPDAPQPQRLMTTLGWWSMGGSAQWPEVIEAFKTIGFNTASAFSRWMDPEDEAQWQMVDTFRDEGFKILNIDSPGHVMHKKHKSNNEWRCQLEDGSHGRRCPSYRGELWQQELDRIAEENARLKPDYYFADIEWWNWAGPTESKQCTRCQKAFEESGFDTWEEWQLRQGYELWVQMAEAVRKAVKEAGGPDVELGVYDWNPQRDYQYFWPFDRLYPEYLGSAQTSTYSPLYPEHIVQVGDECRRDAQLLGKNDCLPWISPGDAGVFSGEQFYRALLEEFFNGARGTNFWSSRMWDGDILRGYARALKVVESVEDIIVDGQVCPERLHTDSDELRISAISRGSDLIFLLGNYWTDDLGTVHVRLPLDEGSFEIVDLETGEVVRRLEKAPYVFTCEMGRQANAAFWGRPVK
ncbi:MAG: hypothetical protein ACLFWB_04040, partial [Armatimonadota bacterium]